jgi:hypothetical protein
MPKARTLTTATWRNRIGGCSQAREINHALAAINPTEHPRANAPRKAASHRRPDAGR